MHFKCYWLLQHVCFHYIIAWLEGKHTQLNRTWKIIRLTNAKQPLELKLLLKWINEIDRIETKLLVCHSQVFAKTCTHVHKMFAHSLATQILNNQNMSELKSAEFAQFNKLHEFERQTHTTRARDECELMSRTQQYYKTIFRLFLRREMLHMNPLNCRLSIFYRLLPCVRSRFEHISRSAHTCNQ